MNFLKDIDRLLRGEATRSSALREGRIEIGIGTLVTACVILGAIYGVFMGLFAIIGPDANIAQLLASAIKVPLLFLLTLAVTFPSLYVLSALADTKLQPSQTLRLLLASIAITLTLLASFGPVTGFFTLSTDSYAFMKLLNVILFAISGLAGVFFLRRVLSALLESEPRSTAAGDDAKEDEVSEQGSPRQAINRAHATRRAQIIFRTWMLIFAAVGAQMAWILRPFIGNPDMPFQLFREGRESNFFEAVLRTIGDLIR